ncbi:AraC family transcriptional regulator [Hypnocyclicus thermotrophus]|uniref:AraC family transcriptional regulator n=1 Tax=Hypnocyclicus thermotrophus TaxID=1627895 RepID=A0AA46DZZ0_9FUSO|nr:AraC family transcriptional regulator [Hypnocyclicus thermotrophus]TDT72019.1 AraC family transcriptional regulator [Hypnocyclicus thermotrophus]
MLNNFNKIAENYDNVESKYLKILYYDLSKGYKDTYKSYNNYRLCTILSGKKKVSVNNNTSFTYNSSEFLLLPPNSSVNMEINTDTKAVVYEFNSHLIEKISNKVEKKFADIENITKLNLSNNLSYSINNLKINIMRNEKEAKFFMDLYAQELVFQLLNEIPKEKNIQNKYNPAKIAKEIIEKDGNENLSIYEIAKILNMSQSNLDYYFKMEYGITPKKYQNKIKIKKSVNLLLKYSVTETAMILGFDNISHFIRLFKQYYNTTPKQYIKRFGK